MEVFILASRGEAKWLKYFAGRVVETHLSKDAVFKNELRTEPLSKGQTILVKEMGAYSPQYLVEWNGDVGWISEAAVAKPVSVLSGADYLSLGEDSEVEWNGKTVPTKCFWSPADLKASILLGLREQKGLSWPLRRSLIQAIEHDGSIWGWDESLTNAQIDHAGAFVGEPLFGLEVLKGCLPVYASAVHFPKTPSFPLIDIFAEVVEGNWCESSTFIPLSHKYHEGAAASLLTNILFPLFDRGDPLPAHSVVRYLKHLDDLGRPHRQGRGKHLIFRWWKMDMDGYEVYRQLRERDISPELARALEDRNGIPENHQVFWPNSLPYHLCWLIADELNRCSSSMDIISNEIAGNGFLQAYMDRKKWHQEAHASYLVKDCREALLKVQIEYGKFARHDITAKEGMLTFRLLKGQ